MDEVPSRLAAVYDSMRPYIEETNEMIFLISEDRQVITASRMAYSVLGFAESAGGAVLTECFSPVFMDAVFSRAENEELRNRSVFIQLHDISGSNVDIEARITCLDLDGSKALLLTCRDIDYYNETISRLTAKEDLYRTIFHESPLGFIHINSDGIVADCNQEFLNIFGYFSGQVIGVCVADEAHADLDHQLCEAALEAIKGARSTYESHFDVDSGLGAKSGWVRVSFSPIMSDNFSFLGAVGIVEDITDEKEAEDKIAYIGSHDALTGLYNRHQCSADTELLDVPENMPLGVIYADLNHLKLANDAFGHEEGDGLLKASSSILSSICGDGDRCYRLGGDEFVVLVRRTSEDDVRDRVRRIEESCAEWQGGGIVRPSMSVGHAVKAGGSARLNDLMKDAEDAMYANKLRNGRSVRRELMTALERRLLDERGGAVMLRSGRIERWGAWAAELLGIDDDADRSKMELLFRYHDIGMLGCIDELDIVSGVPDVGKELQHAVTGYRIARTVNELSIAADLILCHHERWDGKGYPNQLKGEEIPYLARLISIFDMLEGLRCLRPDGGMPFDRALDIVESCAGSLFDPAMARAVAGRLRTERPDI